MIRFGKKRAKLSVSFHQIWIYWRLSEVISDQWLFYTWKMEQEETSCSRQQREGPASTWRNTHQHSSWLQCTWGASVVQTSKNIRKHPTAKLTSLGESTCNGSLKSYYSLTTTDMLPACRLVTGFPDSSVGKNPPAMQEILVRFLGWEDPLETG